MSVGSNYLSLLLSDGHPRSNPLGLAVHSGIHVVLVHGLGQINPLGLGRLVLVLDGDDEVVQECLYVALFSFSSHHVHLHGGLVLDDLGGGEGGASSVVLSTASSSDFSPDYTLPTLFLTTFT